MPEKAARAGAAQIAGVFGKVKTAKRGEEIQTEQLVHLAPEELAAVDQLVEVLGREKREPEGGELQLLKKDHRAVDIALFGRLLAAEPDFSVEAAAQVAHALSVHKVEVEDDFWSAVDDLNRGPGGAEIRGAGHLGEAQFAAGLFYLYLCIERELLVANLDGDGELAARALRALLHAAAKVAPTGKQASFASRAYASYVLAEKGEAQPRSLATAFLAPIEGGDLLAESVSRLTAYREKLDRAYGPTAEAAYVFDVASGAGTFSELLDFVAAPLAAGG